MLSFKGDKRYLDIVRGTPLAEKGPDIEAAAGCAT